MSYTMSSLLLHDYLLHWSNYKNSDPMYWHTPFYLEGKMLMYKSNEDGGHI